MALLYREIILADLNITKKLNFLGRYTEKETGYLGLPFVDLINMKQKRKRKLKIEIEKVRAAKLK